MERRSGHNGRYNLLSQQSKGLYLVASDATQEMLEHTLLLASVALFLFEVVVVEREKYDTTDHQCYPYAQRYYANDTYWTADEHTNGKHQ